MTDDIRNILDPAGTFSDEDVRGLLAHAQKKKSRVWDTILFFRRHDQLPLAMDWLREQGDRKLRQLADVLPRYFEQLDKAPEPTPTVALTINRNEAGVNQMYGQQANSTVVNL